MANILRLKRSTGSSAPGSLANAEPAVSESNEILYYGKGSGGAGGSASQIIKIGGKGAFWDKDTPRAANSILAGAVSGSDAAPDFRALVAADIPSILHTKISDFDAGVRTNRLDQMTAPTGSVSMNSQTITNLADPVNTQDAATRGFVEATAQGLDVKDSCVAATTGNIVIATALNNGDTLDGVTLSNGDRVLVKDQSTASQNGIYVVGASPARAVDLAAGSDAAGMFAFIEQGTVNADNGFVCTSNKGSAVTGTNNLTFAQFSGAGQITAGNGIAKDGNRLDVDLKNGGGLAIESGKIAVNLGHNSISGTLAIGDGGTGATSASAARTNLGVAIGSDVQAFDQQLADIAGLTPSNSVFIVGNGSNFVAESGATARASLGVSIGSQVQAYDEDLDNLSSCQSGASAALSQLTSTEVNILNGATVSTPELNLLDGVTATTTEINYIDGVTSAIQTQLDNKQPLNAKLTELATMVQATANALADLTSSEVQILDGATLSTSELNTLDGATLSVSELNLLDGVTATTDELNHVDGVTSNIQTQLDAKQPLNAKLTELATMGQTTAQKLADLTGTEVAILDGATVTSAELNKLDGNTSATATTLATADRIIVNDNGTMKQVALTDLVTFLENGTVSGFDLDGGTY